MIQRRHPATTSRHLNTLAGGVLLLAVASVSLRSVATEPMRSVLVVATDARTAATEVREAGGVVTLALPIIDGVAARVSARGVSWLLRQRDIRAVTPNEKVGLAGMDWSAENQRSVFARETQADAMWSAGYNGSGVRVALIDTGVSPVQDLADRLVKVPDPTDSRKVADCVNFSGEDTCYDNYGHGTFIAGLIAGTGAASQGVYRGEAPGAQIVPIKIAGRDGSADVTKVLAAIQWAVSFARDLNIRVINLSLGTDSPVSYRIDPLNFAVERAWRAGLVVVVSAGNRGEMTANGPKRGTISKPADDPLVLTTGAIDDRNTNGTNDDRVPAFSAHGPTITDGLAKPDVVAPGGHVISLRSPGSTVEQIAPGGGIDSTYRRGSGTSMSAGILSGAVALVLQKHPDWTPDRVKFALMSTAHPVGSRDPLWIGSGLIATAEAAFTAPAGLANQDVTTLSDATGSLDGSRGNVIVTANCVGLRNSLDPNCGKPIRGMETAQGYSFDMQAYAQSNWTGSSWYMSQWNGLLGSSWYGSSWYGSSWYGSSWYGSSWYGDWDNTSYGSVLPGSSWYGAWD